MQDTLKLYNDIDATLELDSIVGNNGTLSHFQDILQSNSQFKVKYSEMINDLASRSTIFDEGVIGNINENYVDEFNSHTFMKKSALHIDNLSSISSINDAIKVLGQAKDELLAGRHDMSNYTTLTQLPQFMVARLA
ncbi:hypothetical protein [Paraclostridium dentum]|uniref:hypothetical protein n=1 Tax=Paraclostridium dentum TaxID=2662455 RepID=UPI003F395486